jgi:methylated-DNA-[protein]-cysteine S-methyltransferase
MKSTLNCTNEVNGCCTTRIYCRRDCLAGKRTKPENRVYFSSIEEARANGYRACKICLPDGPNPKREFLFTTYYNSPLGRYIIISSRKGVIGLKSEEQEKALATRLERTGVQFQEDKKYAQNVITELDAYFNRRLRRFSVPLDIRGTQFQRRVWQALINIPYGETRSYAEIARAIGQPTASRAVGLANGANPISIIVPCHRVIGSSWKLVGYAGGLDRKQTLLDLESGIARRA